MEERALLILKKFWIKKFFSKQELQFFLWKENIYPILNFLIEKKRIKKLKNSYYYILSPGEEEISQHPFFFLHFLWKGEYIPSYWTALTYYELLEQFFMKNIVLTNENFTTKNHEIEWHIFYKIRNPFHWDFWLKKIIIDWRPYKITDIERTILDCFDKPDYAMWIQEVAKAFYEAIKEKVINFDILLTYLEKYKTKIKIARRIGFLLEKFNISHTIKIKNGYLIDELYKISALASSYSFFDTNTQKITTTYNLEPKWKLYYSKYENFLSLIQY